MAVKRACVRVCISLIRVWSPGVRVGNLSWRSTHTESNTYDTLVCKSTSTSVVRTIQLSKTVTAVVMTYTQKKVT
jgi:hypothetical protein